MFKVNLFFVCVAFFSSDSKPYPEKSVSGFYDYLAIVRPYLGRLSPGSQGSNGTDSHSAVLELEAALADTYSLISNDLPEKQKKTWHNIHKGLLEQAQSYKLGWVQLVYSISLLEIEITTPKMDENTTNNQDTESLAGFMTEYIHLLDLSIEEFGKLENFSASDESTDSPIEMDYPFATKFKNDIKVSKKMAIAFTDLYQAIYKATPTEKLRQDLNLSHSIVMLLLKHSDPLMFQKESEKTKQRLINCFGKIKKEISK